MLADLIIFALIIAFVSVATLGHILLGVALLTGRGDRRASDDKMSARATVPVTSNVASDCQSMPEKLAA